MQEAGSPCFRAAQLGWVGPRFLQKIVILKIFVKVPPARGIESKQVMPVDHQTILRIQMRERAKLFSYIWSIVHDEHIAEDVFQDVGVLAMEKAREIHDAGHLKHWMIRTARFKALKAVRSKHTLVFADETLDCLESKWEKVDADNDPAEMVTALRGCLNTLTPNAKRLVKMRYVDGMPGLEIAASLGRKAESIYSALSRIHRVLAECVRGRLRRDGVHHA